MSSFVIIGTKKNSNLKEALVYLSPTSKDEYPLEGNYRLSYS